MCCVQSLILLTIINWLNLACLLSTILGSLTSNSFIQECWWPGDVFPWPLSWGRIFRENQTNATITDALAPYHSSNSSHGIGFRILSTSLVFQLNNLTSRNNNHANFSCNNSYGFAQICVARICTSNCWNLGMDETISKILLHVLFQALNCQKSCPQSSTGGWTWYQWVSPVSWLYLANFCLLNEFLYNIIK